jgi:arylsulfatase A-like enzyme
MNRKLNMKKWILGAITVVGMTVACFGERPNIVFILADDLGYGDVHVLNPERGLIATPQMDQLAAEGMLFTDAHSGSSVCTPTRYGILTGRYSWRSRLQRSVLFGYDQPLINPDRLTVAGFLKEQGYNTACLGKWHLGLGLPTTDGKNAKKQNGKNIDWKGRITGGPADLGFDYYYGIAASLDMPPYIYIENDHFVGEGSVIKEFHPNREGPANPDLEAVDVLPEIERKSVEYIRRQTADKPFFMYIALTSPHTPIAPEKEWQGKSPLGEYGDFVMQTDDVIGKIVAAVNEAGFAENTVIIVTSDNGCSKAAGIDELQKKGHFPSAQFRGSKSDIWDGGHRVPFIVRWPENVQAGSQSDQTICLVDLMATVAELTGAQLPETAAEDSISFLPALSDKPIVSTRAGIIHHSIGGFFAYRQGKWKLCLSKGSGGWTSPTEKQVRAGSPVAQLYDMEADPGETENLYASHPEVVERLLKQLESDVNRGRSTDGADQSNEVPVKFNKSAPERS